MYLTNKKKYKNWFRKTSKYLRCFQRPVFTFWTLIWQWIYETNNSSYHSLVSWNVHIFLIILIIILIKFLVGKKSESGEKCCKQLLKYLVLTQIYLVKCEKGVKKPVNIHIQDF